VKLTELFKDGSYLVYRDGGKTNIVLRPAATKKDAAEALMLSSLLQKRLDSREFATKKAQLGEEAAVLEAIEASRKALPKDGAFLKELEQKGWNLDKMSILSSRRADWGAGTHRA